MARIWWGRERECGRETETWRSPVPSCTRKFRGAEPRPSATGRRERRVICLVQFGYVGQGPAALHTQDKQHCEAHSPSPSSTHFQVFETQRVVLHFFEVNLAKSPLDSCFSYTLALVFRCEFTLYLRAPRLLPVEVPLMSPVVIVPSCKLTFSSSTGSPQRPENTKGQRESESERGKMAAEKVAGDAAKEQEAPKKQWGAPRVSATDVFQKVKSPTLLLSLSLISPSRRITVRRKSASASTRAFPLTRLGRRLQQMTDRWTL